jgi:hypothetical protein
VGGRAGSVGGRNEPKGARAFMNIEGIFVGLGAFVIIGILHPVVVRGEYHYGTRIWPLFLVAGLACMGLSLLSEARLASDLLGVLGFSLFWSIHELYEQEGRVRKGWYPRNPRRADNAARRAALPPGKKG